MTGDALGLPPGDCDAPGDTPGGGTVPLADAPGDPLGTFAGLAGVAGLMAGLDGTVGDKLLGPGVPVGVGGRGGVPEGETFEA